MAQAIRLEAADSSGLSELRLIKNAEIIKQVTLPGEKKAHLEVEDEFSGDYAYYRGECYSRDNRRAYSNPVWVNRKR